MKHSAFISEGQWYKGNLHSHTTCSDGIMTPEACIQAYKEKGYSFLALTDHNLFTAYPEACSKDFLVLPATERNTSCFPGSYEQIHVVGLKKQDIRDKISQPLSLTFTEEGTEKDWQALLDEMHAAGQLSIIAHPVWTRMSIEKLLTLKDYLGIEIYNTTCDRTSYTGKSDYIIDCCLRKGKKFFLFATDDCHEGEPDMFGGWITVKAPALTHADLMEHICKGSFYASTGPEIYDFGIDDDQVVYVECSPCVSVNFITYEKRGHSIVGKNLTSGSFHLSGTETFVRCECVDAGGKIAYTNPIFLK